MVDCGWRIYRTVQEYWGIYIIFRERVNLYSDDEQFLREVFIGHCHYSWDTPRDYQDVTDNPFMQIYGH